MKVNKLQLCTTTWMNLTNNYVEQKKPDTKEYIAHISIYINTELAKLNPGVMSG